MNNNLQFSCPTCHVTSFNLSVERDRKAEAYNRDSKIKREAFSEERKRIGILCEKATRDYQLLLKWNIKKKISPSSFLFKEYPELAAMFDDSNYPYRLHVYFSDDIFRSRGIDLSSFQNLRPTKIIKCPVCQFEQPIKEE